MGAGRKKPIDSAFSGIFLKTAEALRMGCCCGKSENDDEVKVFIFYVMFVNRNVFDGIFNPLQCFGT